MKFRDSGPTTPITHGYISEILEATSTFYNEGEQKSSQDIVQQVDQISKKVSEISGFEGSYGLGFPFYAIDTNTNDVAHVPAIDEHIGLAQEKLQQSSDIHGSYWPCADCQKTRGLPDLKSQCGPCTEVLFKPRDLFKALPDIDVVCVFDEPTEQTESAVQTALGQMGLIQSDTDIAGAVSRTAETLAGGTASSLPVDAHIWSKDDFLEHCKQLGINPNNPANTIISRSLHSRWEDNPLNFGFDFIFSLTPVGQINPDVTEQVDTTRDKVVTSLGESGLVDHISRISPRGKAILQDPTMKTIFEHRVNSWRK